MNRQGIAIERWNLQKKKSQAGELKIEYYRLIPQLGSSVVRTRRIAKARINKLEKVNRYQPCWKTKGGGKQQKKREQRTLEQWDTIIWSHIHRRGMRRSQSDTEGKQL